MIFVCYINPFIIIPFAVVVAGILIVQGIYVRKNTSPEEHTLESIKDLPEVDQIKILKAWERKAFEDDDEESFQLYKNMRYELEEQIRLKNKNLK